MALTGAASLSGLKPANAGFREGHQVSGRIVIRSRKFPLLREKCLRMTAAAASGEGSSLDVEQKETVLPSGEWPENFSMLNYEDLTRHFEPSLFKEEAQPSTFLADVMARQVFTATADTLLEQVDHHFAKISGLPVVDKDQKCIGVLSKKDKNKGSKGMKSHVSEVMTSPAITLSADKTVSGK